MPPKPRLLIATNNSSKVDEFRSLLAGSGWEILGPLDLGIELEVAETGATYAENARLKALAFQRASGLAALADDSGLEVDALGGAPGPLHHTKGWDGMDQSDRIERLLTAMRDVPAGKRTARFRAVLVVAFADGETLEEEGFCEGQIREKPEGSSGFGYDPVFFLPELGKTMAELSLTEKNRVSHRTAASALITVRLQQANASET